MMLSLTDLQINYRLLIVCILLSMGVLAVDIALPLGVAGGVPYVAVVLIALRAKNPVFPLFVACFVSILTLLGLAYSEPGGTYWMVLANRALALFAIWATALLGLHLMRTQMQLLESEGRFQIMADRVPIMIWSAKPNFDWEFLSASWLQFTGRSSEEESGSGWQEGVHEHDRDRLREEYHCACEQLVPFQIECRLLRSDGEYRWVVIYGAPRYLEDGNLAGLVGTCIDVNDRKEMERELDTTRQKYFHQEKLAAIGSLSAGLIHEIYNPIAGISGIVHQLIEEDNDQIQAAQRGSTREYLDMILEQLERLQRISKDITNFSTARSNEEELQNVNDVIEQTCRLIHYDERMAGIELKLCLDHSIPAVRIMADHFIQLLLNLLFNAVDACNLVTGNARFVISTRMESGYIAMRVEDNGCGMSPDVLARAEEPFFTTKSAGKGTGLGLSLCSDIVSGYGGSIEIESQVGRGTSVQVFIPAETNEEIST